MYMHKKLVNMAFFFCSQNKSGLRGIKKFKPKINFTLHNDVSEKASLIYTNTHTYTHTNADICKRSNNNEMSELYQVFAILCMQCV